MNTHELRDFLKGFAAERVALIERHEAGARVVSHYDFNNTYQYVISREETHLSWLGHALAELDEPLPKASAALPVPALPKLGKKVEPVSLPAGAGRRRGACSTGSASGGGPRLTR